MVLNSKQLKEFIISEVKKSFLTSEEFIGDNDMFPEKSISEPEVPIKLEEAIKEIKEIKQLSEELKRMQELTDFRSLL